MCRVRIWRVAVLFGLALVLLPAAASGQGLPTSRLGVDATRPGTIDVGYFGKPGSTVFFDERVGETVKRFASAKLGPSGYVVLKDALVWRCDRLERYLEATEVQPGGAREGGSFDVRTGSCAQRFALKAPARAALNGLVRVRVVDRWNIGGMQTRFCVTPPRGKAACRSLPFLRAVSVSSRRFRTNKKGLWKIELHVRGYRIRTAVAVGTGRVSVKPAPVVLMTGDSTMQGIDSFLADRLGDKASVRSEVHNGTAISRGLQWITRAAQQAPRLKPKTTVISMGAGEGHPMTTPSRARVECCNPAWLVEYTRRVTLMMKSYLRAGKSKLLWLAQPAPRSVQLAPVTAQVNKAILAAAAGRAGVRVLRLDLLFTPDGRFRDSIIYRGQEVRVRAVDGVHLSAAGTAIAAEVIEEAMRQGPSSDPG